MNTWRPYENERSQPGSDATGHGDRGSVGSRGTTNLTGTATAHCVKASAYAAISTGYPNTSTSVAASGSCRGDGRREGRGRYRNDVGNAVRSVTRPLRSRRLAPWSHSVHQVCLNSAPSGGQLCTAASLCHGSLVVDELGCPATFYAVSWPTRPRFFVVRLIQIRRSRCAYPRCKRRSGR